ncbi:Scavenger mRNA decapping enzyme [Mycena indigotica]|uniref:Scavenger mRNA decapping enzyme n=1 Tax=Mycena indigotica TaxID=2126181 RepID=A0A8H6T147_9AGAR|nr:Scavenger mRNA decapping enzyme [Mycena indigotica]KAF7309748.1 Scavenger mRNA decapping enzyme [Mycena indigotica]
MAEKIDATSTSTDTGSGPRDTTSGGPKAIIKNVDMSDEMQQESVDIASAALEKYNIEKDIAAQIKKEFDRRHGPTWHVVVGKNFGSYVTHETKHFIYFYYMWFAAWLTPSSLNLLPQGDLKVNVICPATEAHIRKYSPQNVIILHETPKMYQEIVVPFIASLPTERTQWIQEILDGRKEQSKIFFSSSSFLIIPDMKWDLHTLSSLYLVAIVRDSSIKSIRDLRTQHIPLLKSIRKEATAVAKEKWAIESGGLRFFIHYHPTYYHFHVHIVHASHDGGLGMRVGQAHLLDDVISLLELDIGNMPSIFEMRTLVYGLGEQHGLYEALKSAQEGLEKD